VYPYKPDDGREQLQAPDDIHRGVRGGAFWLVHQDARCAARDGVVARHVDHFIGFRVVVRPCL
jgi:formylglycine-generating enzyme required for sulfatase activity